MIVFGKGALLQLFLHGFGRLKLVMEAHDEARLLSVGHATVADLCVALANFTRGQRARVLRLDFRLKISIAVKLSRRLREHLLQLTLGLSLLRLLLPSTLASLLARRVPLIDIGHAPLQPIEVIVFVLVLLHQVVQLFVRDTLIVRRAEVVNEVKFFSPIELLD